MDITERVESIDEFIRDRRILSTNDIIGCNESGELLDQAGRVVEDNPCPFAKKYNCDDRTCEYQSWFFSLIIGLPFIAIIILVLGVSIILRGKDNKNKFL